ncbi:hypothetical protein EXIGLDRAFT_828657 [Exidia glandulosa HHB12029]|uniref:ATP-dependent DNA ligase family profile domain-containing protein n=1 Tax=Exidia glandulosa HHB12029 TaxID=1314781 RepID=A0A165Q9X4_EXIGL|nr:hypothetical protein EXIGLDRAFT_828657 [Exidia glandulosa HHB12029]
MDVPFSHFTDLVKTLSAVPPKPVGQRAPDKAHTYLHKWIQSVQTHRDGLAPGTALAFFRLLFPEDDRRRYSMQETALAQCLVDVLAIPSSGRGAGLVGWGDWSRAQAKAGCLGLELEAVLQPSFSRLDGDGLTLRQVDNMLTELAALSPFSQVLAAPLAAPRRSRKVIMRDLFIKLTPYEAAVVTQVILRDMRPLLYPGTAQLHTTLALTGYNSLSYHVLTKWEAMKLWDSNLPRAYRARGSWEEACTAWDEGRLAQACTPRMGVPVEIPKSVKATSCEHVAKLYARSDVIYAETKYDGERMQIHVDMSLPFDQQIRIFSKSKRDSTGDRDATIPLIRDALRDNDTMTAILEAEMVAFSDELGRVDEFWRIRSLVESTARSVRRRVIPKEAHVQNTQSQVQGATQSSMISNASASGTRHLAVVFFDVLTLNGECMLDACYDTRRECLERIVRCSPGYVMLAERIRIDMKSSPVEQIAAVFARRCAEFEEGLVFKAAEGGYNDHWSPWVKLKKDYIPGLGDTLDLAIVGAAWDKDRGRELGVGPGTFTTFWLGCPSGHEMANPKFTFLCTASYGLDRAALDELNFVVNAQDIVQWDKANPEKTVNALKYTCDFGSAVARPQVLLHTPLLAEVMGAGFTKARGALVYELRFPRILKVHRQSDRHWTEGINIEDYQLIARHCVGREKKDKDVDDEVKSMWGLESSPKVRSDLKRKEREEALLDKLCGGNATKRRKVAPLLCPPAAHKTPDVQPLVVPPSSGNPATPESSSRHPLRNSNRPDEPDMHPVEPQTTRPLTPPMTRERRSSPTPAAPSLPRAQQDFSHVMNYLQATFVCILQPRGTAMAKTCITDRPRSHLLIPQGRLFHSVQALLVAIGWHPSGGGARYSERGIIFVDAKEEELVQDLKDVLSEYWRPGLKECRVVDAAILNWDALPHFTTNVEERVLHIWNSSCT